MSDILNEIKESINEKKKNAILSNAVIGIFIFGTIFVIYLGISSWYTNKQRERVEEDGAVLTQTVNSINYTKFKGQTSDEKKEFENKNKAKIEKLEKLGEAASSAYSALADIYLASISLMDGNHTKAIYYYQRIGKNSSYDKLLREYSTLVEINTKLQFNKSEAYESSQNKIHEYFLQNKQEFSNAMAITGIAIADENGQYDTDLYLKSLKEYHSTNDNVHFIVDMLHQYLSTKQIKRENQNDKTK